MNEVEFNELVSAYLDREIDEADMQRLNAELQANDLRRERFEQQKKINLALGIAFESGSVELAKEKRSKPAKEETTTRKPAEVIYLDSQTGDISFTKHGASRQQTRQKANKQPWWSYVGAAAACFVIGAFTLMPVLQQNDLTGGGTNAELAGRTEIPSLGGEALTLNPTPTRTVARTVQPRPLNTSMIEPELPGFSEGDEVALLPKSNYGNPDVYFSSMERGLTPEPTVQRAMQIQRQYTQQNLLPDQPMRARFFNSPNPHLDDFRVQLTSGEIVR